MRQVHLLLASVVCGLFLVAPATGQVVTPLTLTPADIPAFSTQHGHQGRVRVRVTAGRTGIPTSCRVIGSSGYGLLDDQACVLYLARATFVHTPAPRDYEGNVDFRSTSPQPPGVLLDFLDRSGQYATWRLGAPLPPPPPGEPVGVLPCQILGGTGFLICPVRARADEFGLPGLGAPRVVAAEDQRILGVSLPINVDQRASVVARLSTRLGEPCKEREQGASPNTIWVNGPSYVIATPDTVVSAEREVFGESLLLDADTRCPPRSPAI